MNNDFMLACYIMGMTAKEIACLIEAIKRDPESSEAILSMALYIIAMRNTTWH